MSVRGTPTPSVAGNRHRDRDGDVDMDHKPSNTKARAPDVFYGDRDKVERWFVQLDSYFYFSEPEGAQDNNDDRAKVMFAATYMRGRAETWFQPFLRKFFAGTEQHAMFRNYNTFKQTVIQMFGQTNEQSQAVRMVQQLKQRTSAADYSAKFQEYSELTGWDQNSLMEMYRKGLKDHVTKELMTKELISGKAQNLRDLMNESIKVDDALYDRSFKQGRVSYRHNSGSNRGGSSSMNRVRGDPMEIDNINRRRKGGKKAAPKKGGKQRNNQKPDKSKMDCWTCGKPGHMSRDCHSKNKVQRQVATVEQKECNTIMVKEDAKEEVERLNKALVDINKEYNELTDKIDDLRKIPQPEYSVEQEINQSIYEQRQLYDQKTSLRIEIDKWSKIVPREVNIIEVTQDTLTQREECVELLKIVYANREEARQEVEKATFDVTSHAYEADFDGHDFDTQIEKEEWQEELTRLTYAMNSCEATYQQRDWEVTSTKELLRSMIQQEGNNPTQREMEILNPQRPYIMQDHTHEFHELLGVTWCRDTSCPHTHHVQIYGSDEDPEDLFIDRSQDLSPEEEEHSINIILRQDSETGSLAEENPQLSDEEELPENQETQTIAGSDDDNNEDQDSEESDEEGTSSDDSEASVTFDITGAEQVLRMMTFIHEVFEKIFPKQGRKRYLDAYQFDIMLDGLRRMFWNHRQVPCKPHLGEVVRERPPMGSHFLSDGAYFTPGGTYVSKTMRDAVKHLRGGYAQAQQHQDKMFLTLLEEVNGQEEMGARIEQLRKELPTAMKEYDFRPQPENLQAAAEWRKHCSELQKLWLSRNKSEN